MKNYKFPADYKPFIDKYFLRAKEILQAYRLNPTVTYQVFIRHGDVNVFGIDEVLAMLKLYAKIDEIGEVWSLPEGAHFENKETLMTIKAPIQSIIDLETMYLGILSSETTAGAGEYRINIPKVKEKAETIVKLVEGRPVYYFGARHYRYDLDKTISRVCLNAGFAECSTDEGASSVGIVGVGTIPHALEAIFHWTNSATDAVASSTVAFDQVIDKSVPRIALVDYANREHDDTIETAKRLKGNLDGVRIDTCGENRMQGDPIETNRGVTVEGVMAFKEILEREELSHLKVILSSGFGDPQKVKKFVDAEKYLGYKLFDVLAVGGVYPARIATADIVEIEGKPFSKIGRPYIPNKNLVRRI